MLLPLTANLAPRRLGTTPAYASLTTEYAHLPYQSIRDGAVTLDRSLSRTDVAPTIRLPLSRLTFLAVNTSASYRTTLYSKSFDTGGTDGRVGNDTMKAIRDFQLKTGLSPADGYGGLKVLARLRQGG